MLSQRSRYALRSLIMLAQHHGQGPVQIADIARLQNVPRKFLEIILVEMKRAGLVASLRGRAGGYVLARTPAEISFGEVIRLFDGPLALVPCVSKMAYRRCGDCVDEATCAIRRAMAQVRDETAQILDNMTLAEAAAEEATVV